MKENLDRVLSMALEGDPVSLTSFGLERLTFGGHGIPPAATEWEERFSLTGEGILNFQTRRSISDGSGDEIGSYRHVCAKDAVLDLIRLLRNSPLDELPRVRVAPTELRMRMVIAAAGACQETFIALNDIAALDPVRPLLQELDRLEASARSDPAMTLTFQLEMPQHVDRSAPRIPVTLGFRNSGPIGYWLTRPAALAAGVGWERCLLNFGRKPDIQPGFTPLPIEVREAAFETHPAQGLDFLWVGPYATVELSAVAVAEFDQPGSYLARAVYSSYAGEDWLAGHPRLRGCAFSREITFQAE